jgi:hypothetical protein
MFLAICSYWTLEAVKMSEPKKARVTIITRNKNANITSITVDGKTIWEDKAFIRQQYLMAIVDVERKIDQSDLSAAKSVLDKIKAKP